MASFTVRFSNASAAVMVSGWVSHSRVEPSTSASSSVTVPVGSNSLTPNSLQVRGGISACGLMVASIARQRRAQNRQNRANPGVGARALRREQTQNRTARDSRMRFCVCSRGLVLLPMDTNLRAIWASAAPSWGEHAGHIDTRGALVTQAMLDAACLHRGARVLELACGPGGVGIAAAEIVGPGGAVVLSDF